MMNSISRGVDLLGKKESIEEYKLRISKAVSYIDRNIKSKINLEELARAAFFSPFHFHRLFTSIVGETPNEFVKRIRIEKAAHMLVYRKSLSITEVALECGFSSSAAFSRSFKHHYAVSPSEWINNGNSKICKTDSKEWKSNTSLDDYFPDVNNLRGGIKMKVEVKEMPKFHVAYVANLEGYKNDKIGEAWSKLCRWAGPRGFLNENTKFIGISFDDPAITDKDKCRYYACVTVPEEIQNEKAVEVMDIKEGQHAVYRFTGYADDIENAYKDIYSEWLPESGYQPSDQPCYEVYLEEPKGNPMKFVMDMCIPVEPL
ncbi:GyrI-like domain-containing protein [Bacteroidota bacterium]